MRETLQHLKKYQTTNIINIIHIDNFSNIYLKINLIFHFNLVVYIAEMERTHPWLSFPGSEIKIYRLVVELQHFEKLDFLDFILSECTFTYKVNVMDFM